VQDSGAGIVLALGLTAAVVTGCGDQRGGAPDSNAGASGSASADAPTGGASGTGAAPGGGAYADGGTGGATGGGPPAGGRGAGAGVGTSDGGASVGDAAGLGGAAMGGAGGFQTAGSGPGDAESGGSSGSAGTGATEAATGGGSTGGAESGGSGGSAGAGATLPATGGNSSGGGSGAGAMGGAAGSESRPSTCPSADVAPLQNGRVPAGYCAWVWADGLDTPRGIAVDSSGDVLVVERGRERIVLLHDDDGDRVSGPAERLTLVSAPGLNHGIAVDGGHVYASSESSVYRWEYGAGSREVSGMRQTAVSNLPTGGHQTRSVVLDGEGSLYVSIGSGANVDPDSSRSRVVRFTAAQVESGASYDAAEVYADGMRNEVGLRFDAFGRLWGVENGVDNLERQDLGGNIHADNPGEELNLLDQAGGFYGYPYCWTEFLLPAGVGEGPGAQWAHPQFVSDGTHTDAWCKDPANVVAPLVTMQAHSAPLDLLFYPGGAFSADLTGDAFVTFHGSWNRSPATGYKVVRLPFDEGGMPTGEGVPLLEYAGGGDTADDWPHRPVGLAVLPSGVLLITSDASGVVIAVGSTRT